MKANKLETATVEESLACLAPPQQFFSCTQQNMLFKAFKQYVLDLIHSCKINVEYHRLFNTQALLGTCSKDGVILYQYIAWYSNMYMCTAEKLTRLMTVYISQGSHNFVRIGVQNFFMHMYKSRKVYTCVYSWLATLDCAIHMHTKFHTGMLQKETTDKLRQILLEGVLGMDGATQFSCQQCSLGVKTIRTNLMCQGYSYRTSLLILSVVYTLTCHYIYSQLAFRQCL